MTAAAPGAAGLARRLAATPAGLVGGLIVLLVAAAGALAPFVATHDPEALDVLARFAPPSSAHLAGTDHIGRDLYSRLVHGAQVAMLVSLSAIGLALGLGTGLGLLAGVSSRRVDRLVLVLFDIVAAFPSLVLALAAVALFGAGTLNVILIVAVTLVPHFGRVARAQTLLIRHAPFIEAERIVGASALRIALRHVLPNILGPLVVLASMDVPVVITIEAGLSFIGLGVRPPLASWGTIIYDGYAYLTESFWPVLAGSLLLGVATLGFTLFGEALRDAVDPRFRPEP